MDGGVEPPGYELVRALRSAHFRRHVVARHSAGGRHDVPASVARTTHGVRLVGRGTVVGLCFAAMVVSAVRGADLAFAPVPQRLQVTSVELTTAPVPARVGCPRGVVRLRAAFATNGVSGTFTVRWTWRQETLLAERELTVAAGQRLVETQQVLSLRGHRPSHGRAIVEIVDLGLVASRFVVYDCAPRRVR